MARRNNGWRLCRLALAGMATALLAGCAASGGSTSQQSPRASQDECAGVLVGRAALEHEAPEIEAVLPESIAGRELYRWSVRGRCWLLMAGTTDDQMAALIAAVESASPDGQIDISGLGYGVAGRKDTKNDPPYFVWAATRSDNEAEIDLARLLLVRGAGFTSPEMAVDLRQYDEQTIGGKKVWVGTPDMVRQDEHQRGSPYLYQSDDLMFIILTDDPAWAEEAIEKLPQCVRWC